MFVSAIVDITVISIVLFAISQVIQSRFVNRDEMKRQQEEMKEKQKKMQELMKKGDQSRRTNLMQWKRKCLSPCRK